jgi:hypothetical protein
MKGQPYFSPSLLGCTIRQHWRDVSYLATNREALLDRIAVVSFCWAFKRLAKQYRGGRMPTTVNGDFADAEPVLYDVVPYFGSRNRPDGFDEVEIYADVSATVRRAEYWLRNDPPPPAFVSNPARPSRVRSNAATSGASSLI